MADNSVQYLIKADASGFVTEIKKAEGVMNGLESTVNKSSSAIGTALKGLGAYFAISEIKNFAVGIFDVTKNVEGLKNQLNFAGGSVQQGAKDFEYVTEKSKELGLDLERSARSFVKLEMSARNSKVEGQGVKDIFEGIGMASTVMHLSAEESEGALLALQQMMSKGKVSAEELNGQLGERLPGALGIAARSMNMSKSELMDFMKEGKLMSEDFLPKFANQLKQDFAGGMKTSMESLSAQTNLMNIALYEMKVRLGDELQPVFMGIVQGIKAFADGVGDAIKLSKEYKTELKLIGVAVIALTAGYVAYNTYLGLVAIRKKLLTAQTWQLNAAMTANPVGLIVTGIAALTAGVYYAWQNFESFRGAVLGVWEVIKGFGNAIKDYVIDRVTGLVKGLKGLGETFEELFAGNFKKAGEKAITALDDIYGISATKKAYDRGLDISENFGKGYQKGIDSFKTDKEADEKQTSLDVIKGSKKLANDIRNNISIKPTTTTKTSTAKVQEHKILNINLGSLIKEVKFMTGTTEQQVINMREMLIKELTSVINESSLSF